MDKQTTQTYFFTAFFSDESEQFLSPSEPQSGQKVNIRLRTPRIGDLSVRLITEAGQTRSMERTNTSSRFSLFEAELICPEEPVSYYFRIEHRGQHYIYRKNGLKEQDLAEKSDVRFDFRFAPGFHTPNWAKGAVQYQIFPDRFRNGDPTNDVQDREYAYDHSHVRRMADWNSPPAQDDYRCFYGGDIAGILEKLDYLQALGVEAVYLNPIFLSPSSHKYDAQDYEHIDPHFGVIEEDNDLPLESWEYHNGYARQYITRVLSGVNLQKSDALFASLCQEMHRRGMKIILDGVFNHCGSFHRWMDREGIYRDKPGCVPGAFQDENSPYREFFRFTEEYPGFEAWWGFETLPKLCYEQSRTLCQTILSVAEKWLKPPYCIDGWRLDVAADLGHSPAFNHAFWKEFRKRVKAVNPEALIIAEHYGDASAWLQGDQWDSVMNYDGFMDPLTFFLTGMEKHSDGAREDLYQDGPRFFEAMGIVASGFQWNSLQCAMNELSNHDHSRFLTRTNRTVGRLPTHGPEAAGAGVDKAVFREAVAIQMTWPGAPTIYYGDEAGQVGWTDPDNRRTYPWGREDAELIALHQELTSMRRTYPVFRNGSLIPLGAGDGWISYGRFHDTDCAVVVCNNGLELRELPVEVWKAGGEDGEGFCQVFSTVCGHSPAETLRVAQGLLKIPCPPKSVLILVREQQSL